MRCCWWFRLLSLNHCFLMQRPHIFFVAHFLCFLVLGLSAEASRPGAWRVEHLPGSARLSLESIRYVVMPDDSGAVLRAAVDDLCEVFERRYGVTLQVLTDSVRRPKAAIYLGASSRGLRLQHNAFWMRREGTRIFVGGDGERGVLNGVYALCEQLLGARWYWAGDLGLELVGDPVDKFPEGLWREEPAYVMRALYPMNGDFGRRNRLVSRYQFRHNLAKVFTPALYEQEPEVFAEVYGQRRRPRANRQYDAQPDFSEPRAVEIAAAAALACFEQHPERRSFSLSINDNALFDDSEATRALVEPLDYFRGRPNYTDLVFGFMNAVAVKVFEEGGAWSTPSGEPRYLTALAYYWTEQSPSFQLHPRVMPVLTSDRAQWQDPAYRQQDKALIARWANSGAERIATWDYYFGSPYPYPRQFNQWLVDSLKYMSAQGVSVFFSQLPSSWGLDGCKAWLAAQLLWDPSRDAEALLDEYYTHFFGAAAEPMRQFYEHAEAHRNAHVGRAEWIKFYEDEFGIELFDAPVLAELRASIDLAKARVADDARRLARVEVVSAAFGLTEAYAQYHATRSVLVARALQVFDGEAAAAAGLAAQLTAFVQARAAFDALAGDLVEDPLHARLRSFVRYAKSDPVGLALAAMAQGGVLPPSEDLAALGAYAPERAIAAAWARGDRATRSILSNVALRHSKRAPKPRNFLGPDLPKVWGWHFDFRPMEQLSVGPVPAVSEQRAHGVRVTGVDVFSIFRDVPVTGGQGYVLDASLAYRISPDNRTQVRLSWKDAEGRSLGSDLPFRCPTGDSGGLQRIVLPLHAPAEATQLRLRFIVSRQYEGDFLDLQRVDLLEVGGEG
jgi:hypothetical protein